MIVTRNSLVALVVAATMLAGCDTAKERAEKHYQSALFYTESGDVDRAIVEFRNVFVLDEAHRDARRAYAKMLLEAGQAKEAYAQYVRLVEQYPDDLDGLVALSGLAVAAGTWEDADRYISAALKLDPGNPLALIAAAMRDYAHAVAGGDPATIRASMATVEALRKDMPQDLTLRRIVITEAVRSGDLERALSEVETALGQSPQDQSLYALRLAIHMRQNDPAAVEAELVALSGLFPNDQGVKNALISWYRGRGDSAKAETHLRSRLDANPDDPRALADLLRYLAEIRGLTNALDEIDRRIAAGGPATLLLATRAALLHDLGRTQEGIAELRAVIARARVVGGAADLQVALAKMLSDTGEAAEARDLVDGVLADDPGNVEAMRLSAAWLIDADDTTEAIATLRAAMGLAPMDADLMTLLATAHARDGDRDLARQQLALAVQASGQGTEQTIRYARSLIETKDYLAAESVLISALRQRPGQPDLLLVLGDVYATLEDWPRADGVATALERDGTPESRSRAVPVRMAIFVGSGRMAEGIAYLKGLIDEGVGGQKTTFALVRALLDFGHADEALATARDLLATAPEDPGLQFLAAMTSEQAGDAEAAAAYQSIVDGGQADASVWLALARVQTATGGDAEETLERALRAYPGNPSLLWAKASAYEHAGRVDEAIAIYEDLYAHHSASDIAANNLASLLSNHRTDAQSLKRATVVARRLRGSPNPVFQDTYGWIAFLSGDLETARAELEPAAHALDRDAQAQYHLAKTYAALGMNTEAREQFSKVLSIASPDDTRAFVVDARQYLGTWQDARDVSEK